MSQYQIGIIRLPIEKVRQTLLEPQFFPKQLPTRLETMKLSGKRQDLNQEKAAIHLPLGSGSNHIDKAALPGDSASEWILGQAISDLTGSEFVIGSKALSQYQNMHI